MTQANHQRPHLAAHSLFWTDAHPPTIFICVLTQKTSRSSRGLQRLCEPRQSPCWRSPFFLRISRIPVVWSLPRVSREANVVVWTPFCWRYFNEQLLFGVQVASVRSPWKPRQAHGWLGTLKGEDKSPCGRHRGLKRVAVEGEEMKRWYGDRVEALKAGPCSFKSTHNRHSRHLNVNCLLDFHVKHLYPPLWLWHPFTFHEYNNESMMCNGASVLIFWNCVFIWDILNRWRIKTDTQKQSLKYIRSMSWAEEIIRQLSTFTH